MDQRRFIYVYSLVYPAVLGSFLFGFIQSGGPAEERLWVALLMFAYFLLQFGEGAALGGPSPTGKPREQPAGPEEVRFHYGWIRLIQDVVEVICLTWVFAALGFFETGGEKSSHHDSLWWAMAAAFLVPPLFRGLRWMFERWLPQNEKLTADERKDALGLSILSLLAVALCSVEAALLEAPLVIAFLIFLLLVAYVYIFIFRRRSRKA